MNNEVEKAFPTVWSDLLENRNITPQEKPLGIVLGGIPGSGKSILIEKIEKKLDKNIIPINGDDFRIYHPNFKEIYEEYKGDFPKYTSEFSNKMVERVIEEAIKNKFNIVVEGTFRNPNVPISTLSKFEEQGYNTRAMIIAIDKNIAWESTINRYNRDLENGFYARKVEQSSFEEVAANLAKNTKIVLDSGKASLLEVYSRESKLFDSRVNSPKELENVVNNELQRLNQLKKEYQVDFSFNKEQSEKLGQKSYDVLVNGVRADNLLKKDSQLSKALEGLATHKDMQQKGITAEALKSGTIQPLMLNNEFKVNRPEARTINATGSKIEPKKQELQAQKAKSFSL
ncbi:putative zeta toxin, P-loop nucleoside triphosphate hydrolase [Haemophilus haemolyticus M21621]|nr:putative zeta toxin, P-loop nucleoside triphosphate hydrolase [Haemophilus haemolyticus M21621]